MDDEKTITITKSRKAAIILRLPLDKHGDVYMHINKMPQRFLMLKGA
jgi:hypothetical protein